VYDLVKGPFDEPIADSLQPPASKDCVDSKLEENAPAKELFVPHRRVGRTTFQDELIQEGDNIDDRCPGNCGRAGRQPRQEHL